MLSIAQKLKKNSNFATTNTNRLHDNERISIKVRMQSESETF